MCRCPDRAAGASGRLRDLTQVFAIVDPGELFGGRRARRDDFGASLTPPVGHGVHDFRALGALGMTRRRLMFGETIGVDQNNRQWCATCMPETRTALVTGANRGIGLEVCRQLAARGLRDPDGSIVHG